MEGQENTCEQFVKVKSKPALTDLLEKGPGPLSKFLA